MPCPNAIIREPVVATRDQPPFDRVTMDGIAIASGAFTAGRREFRIAGTQAAGSQRMVFASPEACFEVMTGAVLPQGCDCVIPVERITIEDGVATIADDVPVSAEPQHPLARCRLSCRRCVCFRTRHTYRCAGAGRDRIEWPDAGNVSRRPRIMVISTGNELVEPGNPPANGRSTVQMFTAFSQRYSAAAITELAHDHLPDDLDTHAHSACARI